MSQTSPKQPRQDTERLIKELEKAVTAAEETTPRQIALAARPADQETQAEQPEPTIPCLAAPPHPHPAPELESEAIPGEPQFSIPIWGKETDGKTPAEQAEESALLQAAKKIAWLRDEVRRITAELKGSEQHTAEAKQLRRELITGLAELKPMAIRNAKRGRPALLRLILRAVRAKL